MAGVGRNQAALNAASASKAVESPIETEKRVQKEQSAKTVTSRSQIQSDEGVDSSDNSNAPTNVVEDESNSTQQTEQNKDIRISDFDFKENILDEDFENVTYHFKWFMSSMENIKDYQKDYDPLKLTQQVIVAESGVTSRFSIRSAEIQSMVGANFKSRNVTATDIRLQLQETYGLTLFDRLLDAAFVVGAPSIYETPFFFELSFVGHKEDGTTNTLADKYLWYVKLVDVKPEVDITGTTYSIRLILMADVAYQENTFNLREQVELNDVVNIRDFLNKLNEQINSIEEEKFKGYIKKSGALPSKVFRGENIEDNFFNIRIEPGSKINGKSMGELRFRTGNINESTGGKDGSNTFKLEKGWSLSRIIDSMYANLEDFNEGTKAGEVTNEERSEITTIPRIKADTYYGEFLLNTQEFGKSVEFTIRPFEIQRIVNGEPQDDETAEKVSEVILRQIKDRDLLRKRYDYVFSGKNTKVLDLAFNLNALWAVSLSLSPAMLSFRTDDRRSRQLPNNLITKKIDEEELDDLNLEQLYKVKRDIKDSQEDLPIEDRRELASRSFTNQNLVEVDKRIETQEAKIQTSSVSPASQLISSGRLLLENLNEEIGDEISSTLRIKPKYELKTDPPFERYTIGATQPDVGVHKRITVLEQAYAREALLEMDLTIRGDPYWLGPTANEIKRLRTNDSSEKFSDGSILQNARYIIGEENFYFEYQTPTEYNDDTGLLDMNNSTVIRGVYSIYEMTHKFEDGKFTQSFKAFKNINVLVK